MVPDWFIQAKQEGLSPRELRQKIAQSCADSQKHLTGQTQPPSEEWVDMMLFYYEQLLERAPS